MKNIKKQISVGEILSAAEKRKNKIRNILINECNISPDNLSWTNDGYVFFVINGKEYSFNYLDDRKLIKKLVEVLQKQNQKEEN